MDHPHPRTRAEILFFIPYHHPVDGKIQPLLAQGWTLHYEMLFYIVFAALISLSAWGRIGASSPIFAALLALPAIFGSGAAIVDFLSDTIILEFAAGMALHVVSSARMGHSAGRGRGSCGPDSHRLGPRLRSAGASSRRL